MRPKCPAQLTREHFRLSRPLQTSDVAIIVTIERNKLGDCCSAEAAAISVEHHVFHDDAERQTCQSESFQMGNLVAEQTVTGDALRMALHTPQPKTSAEGLAMAKRLREAALERGYRGHGLQRQLSIQAKVSEATVSRILNGEKRPERVPISTVQPLADLLGVRVEWLVTGSMPKTQPTPQAAPDLRGFLAANVASPDIREAAIAHPIGRWSAEAIVMADKRRNLEGPSRLTAEQLLDECERLVQTAEANSSAHVAKPARRDVHSTSRKTTAR